MNFKNKLSWFFIVQFITTVATAMDSSPNKNNDELQKFDIFDLSKTNYNHEKIIKKSAYHLCVLYENNNINNRERSIIPLTNPYSFIEQDSSNKIIGYSNGIESNPSNQQNPKFNGFPAQLLEKDDQEESVGIPVSFAQLSLPQQSIPDPFRFQLMLCSLSEESKDIYSKYSALRENELYLKNPKILLNSEVLDSSSSCSQIKLIEESDDDIGDEYVEHDCIGKIGEFSITLPLSSIIRNSKP